MKVSLDYKITIVIVSIILMLNIAPYVIWGENMYITVWDNMDQNPNLFGLSKLYGLFTLHGSVGIWDDMSCIYMGRGGYTIQNFINHFLPFWEAYAISHIVSVLLGFFSMRCMLKMIFKSQESKIIVSAVSVMYAILPVIPEWEFACAALPLYYVVFQKLYKGHGWKWVLAAFSLVFLMEFNVVVFVVISWLIAMVYVSIRDKKINKMLAWGIIAICIGIIIFNFKLFYMRLAMHEELNRDHYMITKKGSAIYLFCKGIYDYGLSGQPHASSLQKWIILPLSTIFAYILCKRNGVVKILRGNVKYESKVFVLCMTSIVLMTLVCAIDASNGFEWLKRMIPPLNGFNFFRFFIIARLIWYISFAAILIMMVTKERYKKFAFVIIGLQMILLLTSRAPYNDSSRTIAYKLGLFTPKDDVTWKEFYAEDLYDKIKKDINYKGEPIAAVGFHPSILLYNGMNAIDGYLSVYPYAQTLKFRRLVLPEFMVNEEKRKYYDQHGIRRYLYCKEAEFKTIRNKRATPATLRIDPKVFFNEYQGKYIISRAPLKNNLDLDMSLVGSYSSNESIYTLYVYKKM